MTKQSENTVFMHAKIAYVNLLACVPVCVHAIACVSGNSMYLRMI